MENLLKTKLLQYIAALLTACYLPTATADQTIGKAANDLPLFDAHMHYKEPAWQAYPPKTVIELMDQNGVAMALVSSTPDEGTIMLWKHAPKRIVPELRPYHGTAGSGNWTKVEGMETYLSKRMATYPHRGIGEFHIHRLDTEDKPLFETIAKLALKHKAIIHVHSNSRAVEWLYLIEPKLTILWAHAGMTDPPQEVERMLGKYATLYTDTSYREDDILGIGEKIDPIWKKLLVKFSDRFLVGSDTWVNAQWAEYSSIMQLNRKWLQQLPRDAAERIAYKNAERLFGITVNRARQ